MAAVRLKDIASDLGVSLVTVSKVLRNHPDVGARTRERVMQRVREMNYRPNVAARMLVTGRTFNIGLIVPDLVHSFFAEVAKGATPVLRANDYNLLIASSDEEPDLERHEAQQLMSRGVDVLMIASAFNNPDVFAKLEVPYLLLDREIPGLPANFVGVDDEQLGYMATRHLIEHGYRRIAHIGGSQVSTAVGRHAGYRRAVVEAGFGYDSRYFIPRDQMDRFADVSGQAAMERLLLIEPRPDAVFCFNDPMAAGAMKAILAAGLDIPGDIGVVGAGNVRHTDLFRVPLTTVDQASDQIGRSAAALALELAASGSSRKRKAPPKRVLVEPKLIVRESSTGPRPQSR
jgi:LacI family transcriptional regulator